MDDDVFAESLTTQKLMKLTGKTDLSLIEDLKLKIDSRVEFGIGNVGKCDNYDNRQMDAEFKILKT